jgi:hypothetical protein
MLFPHIFIYLLFLSASYFYLLVICPLLFMFSYRIIYVFRIMFAYYFRFCLRAVRVIRALAYAPFALLFVFALVSLLLTRYFHFCFRVISAFICFRTVRVIRALACVYLALRFSANLSVVFRRYRRLYIFYIFLPKSPLYKGRQRSCRAGLSA